MTRTTVHGLHGRIRITNRNKKTGKTNLFNSHFVSQLSDKTTTIVSSQHLDLSGEETNTL